MSPEDATPEATTPEVSLAVPQRSESEDWLEVAKSQTYITAEASYVRRWYSRYEGVDKKFLIRGYNWRRDSRVRSMMKSELLDVLYDIAGLVPREDKVETRRELDEFVEMLDQIDIMKQIPYLRFEISSWIYRTRLGLPPIVPESDFDLVEDEVFAKLEPKIVIEAARRSLRP